MLFSFRSFFVGVMVACIVGCDYHTDEVYFKDVFARHFERMADETGLSKPLVRKRIIDVGNLILDNVDKVEMQNKETSDIATFIRGRCSQELTKF